MSDDVKRGRPVVSPAGKARDRRICLSVNEAEFAALNEKAEAAGLSRTEYILQSTVYADGGCSMASPEIRELIGQVQELGHQVRKLGSNLNQIAFGINLARKRSKALDHDAEMRRAVENVEALRGRAQEVMAGSMDALRDVPLALRRGPRRGE